MRMVGRGADGHTGQHTPVSKLRLVIFSIVIGLLIIGSYSAVRLYVDRDKSAGVQQSTVLADIDADAIDYDAMSDEEVNAQLLRQIGMTYDELASQPVDTLQLDTFLDAYRAGLALYQLGDNDKARAVFEVADKKADDSSNYRFYFDYATLLSEYPGTKQQSLELYATSRSRIQSDDSIPADTKQKLIDKVDFAVESLEST